tara:strand:- start:204 stop:797 length:594 start_codon:yes stop_codon:yes gene_type:complete
MKKELLIIYLSTILIGCGITPRLGTESYIKNKIENHLINEFSEIQTFTIFQGGVEGVEGKGGGYIELVGYKYNNEEGLVISSDKEGIEKKSGVIKPEGITQYYNELSLKDCKNILEKYKILKQKGNESLKRRKKDNTLYFDFTISENLYISIEHVNKGYSRYEDVIHFWIDEQKYSLGSIQIIDNLTSFINWVENKD